MSKVRYVFGFLAAAVILSGVTSAALGLIPGASMGGVAFGLAILLCHEWAKEYARNVSE